MSTAEDRQSAGSTGRARTGRLLVTGGTGFIGRRLVKNLVETGTRVRVLSRAATMARGFGETVEVAAGDITDPSTLAAAVEGCTAVAHLAGEWRAPERYWRVNAAGTSHLLAAAQRAGISHVLHMSSVGVIGARRPGRVDENEPCRPANEYERSKLEAERLVVRWSKDTGIPVSVLRPTIVFGVKPGSPDSVLALLRAIRARRFVYFNRQAVANYVYVDDVVHACRRALELRTPGVFIVADPCLLSEFVETAADALRVPRPRTLVPLPLAYAAAAAMQAMGAVSGRSVPLTVARVRALSSQTKFESSAIDEGLQWTPPIGWSEGLARTIQAYREGGAL